MTTLLPCPFCGAEAEIVLNEPTHGFAFVECCGCGARGAISSEDTSTKLWNRRTFKAVYEDGNLCRIVTDTDAYIPERTCRIVEEGLRYLLPDGSEVFETSCSCCNFYIGEEDNYCPNCGRRIDDD